MHRRVPWQDPRQKRCVLSAPWRPGTYDGFCAKPGHPARHDHEYRRAGTANLFMLFAPLEGWRHVGVTGTRKAVDYAHILKTLSDVHVPDADKITLVQECVACLLYNLNIHTKASLYKAFTPSLSRRISNEVILKRETNAWQKTETKSVQKQFGGSQPKMPK